MMHHIASAVYKRATEGQQPNDLPPWSIAVLLADFIVFLPVLLLLTYTLQQVYPIFTIVEDENPPAYDPVNLNEDEAADVPGVGPIPSKALATGALYGIFSAFLPNILASVATLLAALSLVQLSTAWVHIVITPQSPLHFWSRLPPFKRTFEATARPVAAFWLASLVATWVPIAVGWALGLDLPNFRFGAPTTTVPGTEGSPSDAWKSVVITLISLAFHVLVVIPAEVVLVRVQASLLPEEADTVIPFDRSFEGKVEPRVVGGKGYATMAVAWATYSRAAWKRLVILYVKIFAVCIVTFLLMAAIVVPEVILMMKASKH
uniref:Ubiquitin conjugating n=1 Tax=Colletotrichum fructicola (strain Nara gc5) TaxID=1213859 RepID=L2GFY3_COLFN